MEDSNASPQQQLLERLKASTNILVTVSNNPSVDQLAACLGLTLWLNKIGKHATAVFSGDVPSTLEFLQPEETLEKNTDSLRDFIIALDKSKADKLRYKVEDRVVKIFITPYRTSLSADDLEFSQGDFNVDMVVALGVAEQSDLDLAITAHGRILHDATVATITVDAPSQLGTVNWCDTQASSLSELVVDLGNSLNRETLDGQIATALLTGVVAETARFSNEKTTPQTMNISAQLMSAGANQQLVASKLDESPQSSSAEPPVPDAPSDDSGAAPAAGDPPASSSDGTLEIDHQVAQAEGQQPEQGSSDELPAEPPSEPEPEPAPESPEDSLLPSAPGPAPADETPVNNDAQNDPGQTDADNSQHASRLVTEPPVLGGTLTANSRPDDIVPEPTTDPLSLPPVEPEQPLLDREAPAAFGGSPEPPVPEPLRPAPPSWMPPQPWLNQTPAASEPAEDAQPAPPITDAETLSDIEASVDSPHAQEPEGLDAARDEVMKAIASTPPANPEPVESLNAQPIELAPPEPVAPAPGPPSTAFDPAAMGITEVAENSGDPTVKPTLPDPAAPPVDGPVDQPFTLPLPSASLPPATPAPQQSAQTADPNSPPPVPPPMFPPAA